MNTSYLIKGKLLLIFLILCLCSMGFNLSINEVLYRHSNTSGDLDEFFQFIELYNDSNQTLSLDGYSITGSVSFKFNSSHTVAANGYIVLTQSVSDLNGEFDLFNNPNVVGSFENEFLEYEGSVILRDDNFQTIDHLTYSGWDDWPSTDVGQGYSIQKKHYNLNSNIAGSWKSAAPTPYAINSVFESNYTTLPTIIESAHTPSAPNPNDAVLVTAKIGNTLSNVNVELHYQLVDAGSYIERDDPNYDTDWTILSMNDNGSNGDITSNDSIFSVSLPSNFQVNRRLVRYRIEVSNNSGYEEIYPDQYFDEANFSYYVYNQYDNVGSININNLNPLPTVQLIYNSTPGYNRVAYHTMVVNDEVYDHVRVQRRTFYNSGKPNYTFFCNRSNPVQLYNDEFQPDKVPKENFGFSSTFMNDRNAHGLTESLIFKFFDLNNASASRGDYYHLRIVNSTNSADDFEGIHMLRDQIRNGRSAFNEDFLRERNMPDGNIYNYKGFGLRHSGKNGPYGLWNAEFTTWNDILSNSLDGCSSCPIDPISQADFEQWLDLDNHYGFMIAQELIANNETNYAGQHHYFEYYNPVSQKWRIFPDDFNAVFGAPRDEVALYDRSICDPFEDVRGPVKVPLLAVNNLKVQLEIRMREAVDLLYSPDQSSFLVDNESESIYNPNNATNWTDADKIRRNQTYTSYETDVKDWYKTFMDTRRSYLNSTYSSGKIPAKPTITYTGDPNHAIDGLSFTNSNYSDPQGDAFVSMQWRIGEISDPANPTYQNISEDIYEITPVFLSDEITTFSNAYTFTVGNLEANRTYRARVRYKDATNRWSRWSDAYEFIGTSAQSYIPPAIVISELMIVPTDNCGAEYVELYNNSNSTVDLSNFSIGGGIDFEFNPGTTIASHDVVVIASDSISFVFKHGFSPVGEFNRHISSNGEDILLYGDFDVLADEVNYENNASWPDFSTGNSIEVVDYNLNNDDGSNWVAVSNCGNPGISNQQIDCSTLQVSVSKTDQSCPNINNGEITLSVTGGLGQYNYSWSNGSSTSDINNLAPGNYDVVITDQNNCMLNESLSIASAGSIAPINLSLTSVSQNAINLSWNAISNNNSYNVQYREAGFGSWTTLQTSNNLIQINSLTDCSIYEVRVGGACSTLDANLYNGIESYATSGDLDLTESITDVGCFNGNNGEISLQINNGTPPYQIMWNTNQSTLTINNLVAGPYDVSILDASNCFVNETYIVVESSDLNLSANATNETAVNANDGAITVSVSGGQGPFTYLWSNGASTASINNLTPGSYSVEITDVNGCSKIESYTVNAYDCSAFEISVNGSNESAYQSNDGSAIAFPNFGSAPYTYLWSNGASGLSITNLTPGIYSVTATDQAGCDVTESVEILAFDCSVFNVTISNTNQGSFGVNNGFAFANVLSGVPPYTYSWSTGSTNQSTNNLAPGIYNVTVTDQSGCEIIESVEILPYDCSVLNLLISKNDQNNYGVNDGSATVSIVSGVPPYTYLWSTGATTQGINNLAPNSYSVTVTSGDNCQATSTVNINGINCGNFDATYSIIDESCFGEMDGSITTNVIGGQMPYTYLWSNGSTSSFLSNQTSGTYTVTISDNLGCSTSDIVTINGPLSPISDTAQISDLSSFSSADGAIDLTVSGGVPPYSYFWSTGAVTEDISNLSLGSYWVIISDASNCSYSNSYLIDVMPICSQPININFATSNNGVTVFWDAPANGADDYSFEYRLLGNSLWNVDTSANTLYVLNNLISCSTYEFRISSNCGGLNSTYTKTDTFNTTGCQPPCPSNLIESNNSNLISGLYQVTDFISSNGIVSATSVITYQAENYIFLNDGFEVKIGGDFEAKIDICQ